MAVTEHMHGSHKGLHGAAGSPAEPALLSAGKPSDQSSTDGTQTAALASDGNSATDNSLCSATGTGGGQFWEVNLGGSFQLVNVTVLGRSV